MRTAREFRKAFTEADEEVLTSRETGRRGREFHFT